MIVPTVAYSFLSISMILCNKFLSQHITRQWALVLFQSLFATLVNLFLVLIGVIPMQQGMRFLPRIFPLGLFFAGMLYTNMKAISSLSVPTLIVFKNAGIALTLLVDWVVNAQPVSRKSVLCVSILICSAIFSGSHDLDFNVVGLTWVVTNMVFQTAFSLFSKHIQQKYSLTPMVLSVFNNMFTCAVILLFSVPTCDRCSDVLRDEFLRMNGVAVTTLVASAFVGFFFGPCTFWCIAKTSPSHVSILGAFNKIPVAVISALLFHTQIRRDGWVFICVNLLSALLYFVDLDRAMHSMTLFAGYKRVSAVQGGKV